MIEFIKGITDHSTLGVWRINESIDELERGVLKNEKEHARHYHPKKKKEHYASRMLIAKVMNSLGLEYHGIVKDNHGKPFLGGYDMHLSITHNDDFVGCLINRLHPCGMDIEHQRVQLPRIMRKYLNDHEQMLYGGDMERLTVAWSAKEAIYKIYGRKNLHFSQDIRIISMSFDEVQASVTVADVQKDYLLKVERLDQSFLVYSL